MNTGLCQTVLNDLFQFIFGARNAAAASSKGVCRADDRGKTDFRIGLFELLDFGQDETFRDRFTDLDHKFLEEITVFTMIDCFERGAEDLDAFKGAHFIEFSCKVQTGLAAHT